RRHPLQRDGGRRARRAGSPDRCGHLSSTLSDQGVISRTLAVDYDRRVKVDAQPRTSKERILDAALDVLVEVDYERASISEISRRAGLPVGSIYHHFGSKAGVFAAVSTGLSQHFWAAFEHTATSPSATIAQRLQE